MHLEPLTTDLGIVAKAENGESNPSSDDILSLVSSHGLALFRGFPLDLDEFYELAEQISPGAQRGVGDDDHGLQLHGEGYYVPYRIDLLWFYCITPADSGGATIFADGIPVVEKLSQGSRSFFDENPLVYKIRVGKPMWSAVVGDLPVDAAADKLQHEVLGPIARSFGEGSGFSCAPGSGDIINAEFQRKAIIPTRWGEQQAFVNTLLHAVDAKAAAMNAHFYRMITPVPAKVLQEVEQLTDELTKELYWHQGDFAIVDNSRLMHGRRAFTGPRNIQAINGVMPEA